MVDALLGAILQAVGDAGQGGHDPRIVRDLPILLRHIEVAPEMKVKVKMEAKANFSMKLPF